MAGQYTLPVHDLNNKQAHIQAVPQISLCFWLSIDLSIPGPMILTECDFFLMGLLKGASVNIILASTIIVRI